MNDSLFLGMTLFSWLMFLTGALFTHITYKMLEFEIGSWKNIFKRFTFQVLGTSPVFILVIVLLIKNYGGGK